MSPVTSQFVLLNGMGEVDYHAECQLKATMAHPYSGCTTPLENQKVWAVRAQLTLYFLP